VYLFIPVWLLGQTSEMKKIYLAFLTVSEIICFLLVFTRQNITMFFDNLKSHKMCRAGPAPEFHVNFGSGRVGSLHLWVGLGRVKKTGPASNSETDSDTSVT